MAYEYYELLWVGKDASADELKKAYRKKAMEHHPDRHGGDKSKEAEFKKINEAYTILSDPQKRAMYDQSGGRSDFSAGFGGGAGNPFGEWFDFSDIFDMFSGGFSQGGGRSRREVGEDVEIEISATFEETILGGKRKIAYDRFETCPDCEGTGGASKEDVISCPDCGGNGRVRQRTQTIFGTMEQVVSCPRCHGSGKTVKNPCKGCGGKRYKKAHVEKEVDIPAGIEEGMTIKIRGEWHGGKDGDGDLFIHFRAPSEKDGLVRDDTHLFYTLTLTPAEMAIGGDHEIDLPVLGKRKITVKAGSQHHDRVTFHKEWLPSIPGGRKGDLVISLEVRIPTKLSSREKELYKELLAETQSGKSGGVFGGLF